MNLKESYTVLMLPFSIDAQRWHLPTDGMWQPAEMKTEDDVFYSHIKDWMQAGANAANRNTVEHRAHNYDIYTPGGDAATGTGVKERLAVWRKIMSKQWRLEKKDIAFKFVNKETELLSTKLMVNTFAGVGLLLLTLQLGDDAMTVERLMELNYTIHKVDRQCPAIIPAIDLETAHPKQVEDYRRVTAALHEGGEALRWDMNNLMAFLLSDVAGTYTPFNVTRLHVFTYYRVAQADAGEECDHNFLRIVRSENGNYEPNFSQTEELILRPFSNICMGAGVEGGAIMTLSTDEDDDPTTGSNHIRNFATSSLSKRYLWIYVMTVLQRLTLLRMSAELTTIDPMAQEDSSLTKLQSLLERMATLKVTTYFTDISDYTQHNDYYTYCVERLKVKANFDEVDEKMELLRTTITNRKTEREEAKNDRLTIILAILTVASATCDSLTVLTLDRWNPISGIVVALALSFLILYMWMRHDRS